MKGKDVIDFIRQNHLEEAEVYQDEYEECNCPVETIVVRIVYGENAVVLNGGN